MFQGLYNKDENIGLEFLIKGESYQDIQIIDNGLIETTIVFNGTDLDMYILYKNGNFSEKEANLNIFKNEPILFYDYPSPDNPHRSEEDLIINTVSGKQFIIKKHNIALTHIIDNVINKERIKDERISYYKNNKIDEWNEISSS